MPDTRTDLASLALDALGRAVLSDDLLTTIEEYEAIVSAGGTNGWCPGPGMNDGCINNSCNSSENTNCLNLTMCETSMNLSFCHVPRDVPGG